MNISKIAFAAASLLLGATAANAFPAPTAIEGLRTQEPAVPGEQTQCTEDGVWCVVRPIVETDEMRTTGSPIRVLYGKGEARAQIATIPLKQGNSVELEYEPWYAVVRFAMPDQPEMALIGIVSTERQMYSGGGSSVDRLTLYEVSSDRPDTVREVVTDLPWLAHVGIRACFTEEDATARRDACQDEYDFGIQMGPDQEATSEEQPRLVIKTQAQTYPGRRSRNEDSTTAPPLGESDLVWFQVPECSVTRTLARSSDGSWSLDQPMPACPDFLEP